jgi:hypothetical protein
MKRPPFACALALTCGSIVACGSGSSSTAAPSVSPPAGTFTASDFTTVVPSGWSDETQNQSVVASVSVSGTVLMLLLAPPTKSNVVDEHIDVSSVSSPVPDDQLAGYLQSVGQKGATNLTSPETVDVDGVTGLFITYDYQPSGGVSHEIEDMVVNRNGTTYEIILNTAAADFSGQLPALQQVLSAWKWTASGS